MENTCSHLRGKQPQLVPFHPAADNQRPARPNPRRIRGEEAFVLCSFRLCLRVSKGFTLTFGGVHARSALPPPDRGHGCGLKSSPTAVQRAADRRAEQLSLRGAMVRPA